MLYQDAFLKRLENGLRAALPNWGLPTDAPVSLLTISENATFLAEDEARGRRMILRVHRPDYHSEAEILSELAWISAMREAGVVETPRPIAAKDGTLLCSFADEGTVRYIVAFDFMPGKEPAAEDDLVKWYGRLGGINARLHAHSRSWQRPAGFARKIWNFDTTIGKSAYWGDWREALGLEPQGRAILERTEKLLEKETAAFGMDADKFGLIHCDMRPANLLVDGDRLGVIDFDDCGLSWFAYDFAAAVSFQEAEPYLDEVKAAWIDGYRSVAPLSAEEEAALPMFLMLRRMQLTAWIASHAETPTAQSMGVPYTDGTVALAEKYLGRKI
ncbi:aminoglycoside phosphotransferase [Terrihabitans soli]|uniref:Aminoglycoside phosphotransferase n=1 Tax=Terrihabitans soli TaxID=708113 RepID=A0A6S6QRN2_9HYPH|nr:phosphotransferase enzyme family protein [Terrihabitans soli]BCJ89932.1 aminoglycoside phosphotransferase [Terrihabitans soli]